MKAKVYFCYVLNGARSDPYEINEIIDSDDIEQYRQRLCEKYKAEIVLNWGFNLESNYYPPRAKDIAELKPKPKGFSIPVI